MIHLVHVKVTARFIDNKMKPSVATISGRTFLQSAHEHFEHQRAVVIHTKLQGYRRFGSRLYFSPETSTKSATKQ